MDAASYAVHRDQSMRDNANKILQMMLAAKQFMSGRDFDERQFAYKQEQDAADNARQAEYVKSQADYGKGVLANQERTAKRLEESEAREAKDKKFDRSMALYGQTFGGKPEKDELAIHEGKARIDAKYREPKSPDKPSAWTERMLEIEKAGKMLGLGDKEIAQAKLDYATAKGQGLNDTDALGALGWGGSTAPTTDTKGKPGPDGKIRYKHKDGKWYLTPEK